MPDLRYVCVGKLRTLGPFPDEPAAGGTNLGRIKIRLNGHFRLSDIHGNDLTPVSEKAQAMLALLATSRDLKCSRSWLQDKLWSESDHTRGSASLRQTLSTIRKCLGSCAQIISATRNSVWLDENRIEVAWSQESQRIGDGFLEGLDIQDPEFNNWLRVMRGGMPAGGETGYFPTANNRHHNLKWKLVLIGGKNSISTSYYLENEFINLLTRNLSENGEIDLAYELEDDPDDTVLAVDVNAFHVDETRIGLRVSARHPSMNRVFWTESAISGSLNGSIEKSLDFLGLAFRLQTALGKEITLYSHSRDTKAFPQLVLSAAIPRIFSFRPTEIAHAGQLLEEALDEENAARFLGWQAQISVINLIERFTEAPDACIERGMMLAAKAVEADPMNSVVLSTAANAQVLLDWDIATGAELAGLAIRVNPSNPLGWWAYANVALYSDDAEKALNTAKIAARLAARSPLQFWCDFQVGLAALQAGDIEQAKRAMETSAALSPQFRPPRRYLLAIYAHLGQFGSAQRIIHQIIRLEPEFTIDSFLHDPDYPVSLAKKANIIDSAAFLELSG